MQQISNHEQLQYCQVVCVMALWRKASVSLFTTQEYGPVDVPQMILAGDGAHGKKNSRIDCMCASALGLTAASQEATEADYDYDAAVEDVPIESEVYDER